MRKTGQRHAALNHLEHRDGILVWGGKTLTAIADDIGSTPFYAYDRALMTSRVSDLRRHVPKALDIHFAMKANPMPDVVRHMASIVDGLDVASAGELRVALASGADPKRISFAGPGKRDEELSLAISSGITINVESPNELQRICTLGESLRCTPEVAIRVNPAFELKSSGMKMGGLPSQFGIDAEQVPSLLDLLGQMDVSFRGFHVYSGSQNLRTEAIENSLTQTVDLVIELSANAPNPPNYLNLGGGLGIPYFPGEEAIDLSELSGVIAESVSKLRDAFGEIEIVTELGRFLVGESGIYVTRIVDVKRSRGKKFAVCDGGLNHHLAASGNFGQVLRKNYPLVVGNRIAEANVESCYVVGPLCTPLDLLGNDMMLPDVEVGDLIVVLQSGAYGYSASPTAFLSHPEPAERLL